MITDLLFLIGRFHPLLVHLPIGVLLLAFVFELVQFRSPHLHLRSAISITLWIGACSAVLAGITGYLLSQTASYDNDTVAWHQWLGIATTVISIVWLVLHHRPGLSGMNIFVGVLVFILLMFTGHLGGTLTHGEDYLSFTKSDDDTVAIVKRRPITDLNDAVIYADLVQPIIEARCYSCHGTTKQKGKLRLDNTEDILRGGKNGAVLSATSGEKPELVRRLLLPLNDKKHMPPKNKTQLTPAETELIHWWVTTGASFEQKVKDLEISEKTKSMLQEIVNPATNATLTAKPMEPVEAADPRAIQLLRERGVVILPVSAGSNYLTINFVSVENANDADVRLLVPLQKQIITLKLADSKITDSSLKIVSGFANLRSLYLERTAITDAGVAQLSTLKELQNLNLVGTGVTAAGLLSLSKVASLKRIFLYQTKVAKESWAELITAFPNTTLDSGGYQVPILPGDTSMIKPKKK